MPAGRHKSRSLRRVYTKLPGSKVVIHYKKRKPSKAVCSECGVQLHGVPRERPYKMQTMAKTKKRPLRPYGGFLCSKCMRAKLKQRVENV